MKECMEEGEKGSEGDKAMEMDEEKETEGKEN